MRFMIFIAKDNPTAAIRTIQAIYEKAQLLVRFPETGYRHIDILGIFHGSLDIERYLK